MKIRIRILSGARQIADKHGWMSWRVKDRQWLNSKHFQNYPDPDTIDWSKARRISLSKLYKLLLEKSSDCGTTVETVEK